MHLKKSTGLPGGGGMVRVLPTEDDGNPMVDKKFARCVAWHRFPNLLSSRRNFEKVMYFESLVHST
jgi:hypothetical protein